MQRTYKIILYSDLHLKVNDQLGFPTADGVSSRVFEKLKALDSVIDYAITNKCNEIIDLGDLFHSVNPSTKLRNMYARTIKRAIVDNHIKVTRITGNHENDGHNADGEDLSILSSDGLYKVITKIELHQTIPEILFIPDIDLEDITKALLKYPHHMVMGHFDVVGALYSSGVILDKGIGDLFFRNRKWPTFLGHIHTRQFLYDKKVNFIGALCKESFSDAKIPTGCMLLELVFDIDGLASYRNEFIDIPDIGLHKIVIEEGKESEEISLSEGDFVRIVYRGSHKWLSSLDMNKYPELVKKLGGIVSVEVNPIADLYNNDDVLDGIDMDSIDFIKLIKNKAKADCVDDSVGLQYIKRAMENG